MLGFQPEPVLVELVGWLVFLVPVGVYVAWPAGRGLGRRGSAAVLAGVAVVTGCTAGVLIASLPPAPKASPVAGSAVVRASAGTPSTQVIGGVTVSLIRRGGVASAHLSMLDPRLGTAGRAQTIPVSEGEAATVAGLHVRRYRATLIARTQRMQLSLPELAALNGGRVPIGLGAGASGTRSVTVTSTARTTVMLTAAMRTGSITSAAWSRHVETVVRRPGGREISLPDSRQVVTLDLSTSARATAAAQAAEHDAARRAWMQPATIAAALAALAALLGILFIYGTSRRPPRGDRRPSAATAPVLS